MFGVGPRIFISSESFGNNVNEAVKWIRVYNFGLNTKIRFGKKGNTIWFYNFAYEFSEKYDVDFKDDPSVFGEYRSKNASFRTGISFRF